MKINYLITRRPLENIASLPVSVISFAEIDDRLPDDARLFLVDLDEIAELEAAVRMIRQNPAAAVYLKPIFILNGCSGIPDFINRLVDGCLRGPDYAELEVRDLLDKADNINSRLGQIPADNFFNDSNISLKLIRFLFSRDKELLPLSDSASPLGYLYPEIDMFLGMKDESPVNVLDFLEAERLLNASFYARAHLCHSCHSAFLNFQEVCPDCSSADLDYEELIHHFRCAHIAPLPEFKRKNGKLVCPKCDDQLRDLGVDFDKPSGVHRCNSCSHTTQDPKIMTTCFHCGASSPPENLIIQDFKRYSLTALALNTALYGLDGMFSKILSRDVNTISIKAFKIMLASEIERIKRYKLSTSTVIFFEMADMENLYITFGDRTEEMFKEISAIIRMILRTSDVATAINENSFFCLLPETPLDGAVIAVRRLLEKIEALFENNLQYTLQINTSCIPISAEATADELLEELIANAHSK